MDAEIKIAEKEGVDRLLERIRVRLSSQIRLDDAPGHRNSSAGDNAQVTVPSLRLLLEEVRALQGQVGKINPRPSGGFNNVIQVFKRGLQRVLGWYTRPLVLYQVTTIQFLAGMVEMLDRDQSRLLSLEARVGLLTDELAALRQSMQTKLEWIAKEGVKREGGGS